MRGPVGDGGGEAFQKPGASSGCLFPSNVCFWYTWKNGTLSAARPNGWVSAENRIRSLLFPIVHFALTGLFRFFLLEESAHYVNR